MGAQGVLLCDANCECEPPCMIGDCGNCGSLMPDSLLVTFSGVSVTECVDEIGDNSAIKITGNTAYINGTFCVEKADGCTYRLNFPASTIVTYYGTELTCDAVEEEGEDSLDSGIIICRAEGKWVVRVFVIAFGVEAVNVFYGEITTDDCTTAGVASNDLSGDGSIFEIENCGAVSDPSEVYDFGSGGTATVSLCCL